MEWKQKGKICIVQKNIAYSLILYLNCYCTVSPARLFHILPARFRCSFEEREREIEREIDREREGEREGEREREKQCMKGKQILLCERLLNELNTV